MSNAPHSSEVDANQSNENECEESATVEPNLNLNYDENYKKYIHSFNVQQSGENRRFVRCKVCIKYPEIVRRNCDNRKPAPITTDVGVRFRTKYVEDHFATPYHKECVKADRIAQKEIEKVNENKQLMDSHVSEANKAYANHIGKLMINVYNDAKKLTISAYSFPSRYIAAECANSFDFNKSNAPTIPTNVNIQYVNPPGHLNLLKTIVKSSDDLENCVLSALACSIHIDGSIDKIYNILKIVTPEGNLETVFLGIGQQTLSGSGGLMIAIRDGIIENTGVYLYSVIMSRVTSICTDGANINKGDRHGLWALFEKELQLYRTDKPLIKMWCSAHRIELVWDKVADVHDEIERNLSILSAIASYFHKSSMRVERLKKIAADENLVLLSLPKMFDVRWTEWSHITVQNALRSWKALVLYFEANKQNDAQAAGFLKFLKSHQNLKTLAFICDLLHIYQRYHKSIQSDNLTIVTLHEYISSLKEAMIDLKDNCLMGGWEEVLKTSIVAADGKNHLKDIVLTGNVITRGNAPKDFEEERKKIIQTLLECLEERFSDDSQIIAIVEPFINFHGKAVVRDIHEKFAKDLDLSALVLQYNELIRIMPKEIRSLREKIKFMQNQENAANYSEIVTVFCRIQSFTPQSADVERLIKANNLIKTAFRTSIAIETENKYLFVYYNMPVLEKWNPRKAITLWINDKKRREHANLIERDSAKNASYFKGIFSSVGDDDDDETSETSIKQKERQTKNKITF